MLIEEKEQEQKKIIQIKKYNLYGMDKFYPYNREANNLFRQLQKTYLTEKQLVILKQQGYDYEILKRSAV